MTLELLFQDIVRMKAREQRDTGSFCILTRYNSIPNARKAKIRSDKPTSIEMTICLIPERKERARACYGFDIVSSSMHGFDRDSEYGTNTYGSWFDPELMYYVPFDDLKKRIVKNTGNRLPCYCSACKQIPNLEKVERDTWYLLRREHYVLTMNEYMRMIRQAIEDRNIELAREKILNSDISGLKNLIPRTETERG